MIFTISNQELDVQVVSEGTYRSPKTGAILREMTVSFTIRGKNASDRYNYLEQEARRIGLVSEETAWDLYDFTGSGLEGNGDEMTYRSLWILREQEKTEEK